MLVQLQNILKKVLDSLIRFRFIIGIFALIIIVVFKINGSSINAWQDMFSSNNTQISGQTRTVRSDEWKVQTPLALAQYYDDFNVHNSNISNDGQNMILQYNAPVKDISIIGKPFNWGFLFLKPDRALSWYWGTKVIGLLLISFETCLIITHKNKYLALLGSLWITLSPAIQWWFMQHVGDLAFFTLAIFVSYMNYLVGDNSKLKKIGLLSLFVSSSIGFVLVIYPAIQVPMAYFLIIMFVVALKKYWKSIKLKKFDFISIFVSVLLILMVLIHVYLISKNDLKLLMNTAYPGHRVSLGGGATLIDMFGYLSNWLIPFRDINFANNCEVSNYFNFLPVVLVLSPWLMFKNKKIDWIGLGLIVSSVIFLVWSFVSFPESVAKMTLLSYVTSSRSIICMNFFGMLASIWFISQLLTSNNFGLKLSLVVTTLMSGIYYFVISSSSLASYFGPKGKYLTILFFAVLVFTLLYKKIRKLFYPLMLILIIVGGFFVNPINIGVGAITETQVAHEVSSIRKSNPNARWIGSGQSYNYLPALGVKTFNSVDFYPNMKTWKQLDPKQKNIDIYNRYAHVQVEVTKGETSFTLNAPDNFTIFMNTSDLLQMKINYICTQVDLTNFNDSKLTFKQVSNVDSHGWRIYKLINV